MRIPKRTLACLLTVLMAAPMWSQTASPVVSFYNSEEESMVEMSPSDSQTMPAPLDITCTSNIDFEGTAYTNKRVEWRIYNSDEGENSPILTRNDDDITYTLTRSGGYGIKLYITFSDADGNEIEYESEPFTIVISESKLSCPDGFSPNGDGINDVYHIEYESIVKLEGAVFNRWGKKLHTFTLQNIDQGWDGMVGGKPVRDGIYLLNIEAVGSEGVKYKIKKVINVLKGFIETDQNSTPG